jgi:hypothetical protein
MVPNYAFDDARKKYAPSLSFYESGALRHIRLSSPKMVKLQGGKLFPAEKLLFYESGALKRLFPTDGRISGYWSLADERKLNRKIDLKLPFGSFSLYLSILSFYESGELKSLTLWPGEELSIPLPGDLGMVSVGAGFSLYENGDLQSVEPKSPIKVPTPLGEMEAFDPEAAGITADDNSLKFTPDGKLSALKSLVIIEGTSETGPVLLSPAVKPHHFRDKGKMHIPLSLKFEGDLLRASRDIPGEPRLSFELGKGVRIRPYIAPVLTEIRLSGGGFFLFKKFLTLA